MNNDNYDHLFNTILSLKNIDECRDFFMDLCTYKELDAFCQRLNAAKLLLDGETYGEIIKNSDISSATLSRVSRCVKYGNGYKTVLKK